MRTMLVICALFALVLWSVIDGSVHENRRITQLEMALAQAHAHADTLEAMLGEGD